MGTTAGPHAVAMVTKSDNTEVTYAYDDNGNNVSSSDGRTIAWATFDKPTSIAKGRHTTAFAYAPDRSRFRRIDSNAQGDTTTLYLGGVEKITHPDDSTETKRYIGGVVIETEGPAIGTCPADATRYVLCDHLGSVDVLTDSLGNEVKSVSFDAWGRARNPVDWTELTDMEVMTVDLCDTRRGFTNHEMLDAVGVIHMNGRIYDPTLARFLQADPFVQFPSNLQSHNRYSYVMNNPLAYTDPSGHLAFSLAATLFLAKTSLDIGLVAAIATLSAAGFADALVQGASFGQALQAGFLSGISAAAFSGIGGYLGSNFSGTFAAGLSPGGFALKVLFHGTVGGITSVLGGGRFGHGFASGGVTALGTSFNNSQYIGRQGYSPLRVAIGAAIGGTASRLTGGKFANGAITGAFSQAMNQEQAETRSERVRPHQGQVVDSPDGRFSPEGEFRRNTDGSPRPHNGVDYAGDIGDEIIAASGGRVDFGCEPTVCAESGNQVTIEHPDGSFTRYFHLDSVDVREGQSVATGERIGTLGRTGNAFSTPQPHLHFEVRQGGVVGTPVNPEEWLRR